jgi:lysophospholipase L1-like esterase
MPRRGAFLLLVALALAVLVTGCAPATHTAEAPQRSEGNASGPLLVVIGDSYSQGWDNTVVWPELFAEAHGYRLENLSISGTGYVNTAGATTFVERIRQADVADPSLILFAGSRNDVLSSADEVRAAARDAFAVARKRFPDARVIAVGPIWDSSDPIPAVEAINAGVARAAEAAGVEFIDALAANWLRNPSVIHPDGIHATDDGQQDLADGIAASIADPPETKVTP